MQSKPKVLQRFDTKPPLGYVEVKRVQILQRIRNSMDSTEQLKIIKNSRHLHRKWYRTTYPDVAELGMDPAEHYLRYGATMGRNPGKVFDTQFYLETYPDVAESG